MLGPEVAFSGKICDGASNFEDPNNSPLRLPYAYDHAGRRVKRKVGSVTTYYLYGLTGLMSEFSTSDIDNDAQAAAADDRLQYRVGEQTGTAVMLMDSGGVPRENNRVFPFGEPWLAFANSNNTEKFTTYQHDNDASSDLDYAMARYYASRSGRFMTPDPGHVGADARNPQSWNAYTYTENDPINSVDRNGKWDTSLHAEIIYQALPGLFSPAQQRRLVGRQHALDDVRISLMAGMEPIHAMRGRNETSAAAEAKMWNFVANNASLSRNALNSDGSFTDLALDHLGNLMHTLQDYTSPQHRSPAGELLSYSLLLAASHRFGENSPNDDRFRFGLAIRLTLAAVVDVSPRWAAEHGLTRENIDRKADQRIIRYFDLTSPTRLPGLGDPVRESIDLACARGNSAACVPD